MSFRLVPNSVTLDDLERRNSPNRSVISPNSVAFGTDYVKVHVRNLILMSFLSLVGMSLLLLYPDIAALTSA